MKRMFSHPFSENICSAHPNKFPVVEKNNLSTSATSCRLGKRSVRVRAVSASPSLSPEDCVLAAGDGEAAGSIPRSAGASRKRCHTLTLRSQSGLDAFSPDLEPCRCSLSMCSAAVWLLR